MAYKSNNDHVFGGIIITIGTTEWKATTFSVPRTGMETVDLPDEIGDAYDWVGTNSYKDGTATLMRDQIGSPSANPASPDEFTYDGDTYVLTNVEEGRNQSEGATWEISFRLKIHQ